MDVGLSVAHAPAQMSGGGGHNQRGCLSLAVWLVYSDDDRAPLRGVRDQRALHG